MHTWKFEMWCRRRIGKISWKFRVKNVLHRVKERSTYTKQGRRLIGLVISCVETAFWNTLLKERSKGSVNGKEDISCYWMILRKEVRHWKLREEALDRTVWGIRLGRGCRHVLRRTPEWMNEWINGYMNEWINECVNKWMNVWIYEWINE